MDVYHQEAYRDYSKKIREYDLLAKRINLPNGIDLTEIDRKLLTRNTIGTNTSLS